MNSKIKNLNEEKVLFFDIETVYKNPNLEIDSPEYLAFQHKMREKSTDELMEAHEVLDMYKRKAPLYLTYNKIVCISVGMVKNGVVRIKSLTGDEKDIIKQFCDIANQFDYLAGVNIVNFDISILVANGAKYFNMSEILKDNFNPSGKKEWNLTDKFFIDLLLMFKGTSFINPSLVEMCLHFGIETPKDDISGADVSRVFYEEENGIERIANYCNKDVFATINLFQAMRHQDRFDSFVNAGADKKEESNKHQTLLHELYETKMFNQTFKDKFKATLKSKKVKNAEKDLVERMLLTSYLERIAIVDYEAKAKEEINKNRTEEVKQFIKEL